MHIMHNTSAHAYDVRGHAACVYFNFSCNAMLNQPRRLGAAYYYYEVLGGTCDSTKLHMLF